MTVCDAGAWSSLLQVSALFSVLALKRGMCESSSIVGGTKTEWMKGVAELVCG